jgi:hypothetical protein
VRLAGRAAYDRKTISRFLLAPARAAGLWAQARADKQAGSPSPHLTERLEAGVRNAKC